jgi:TetR/AcrR family transcriptional regulator, cholesterol catabolism regulator
METLVTNKVSIVLSPRFQLMETKERISKKAEELFLGYGIRSVSMDDIAAQLGMSKKTIYQYFSDKDELVDSVVEGHIKLIQYDCNDCKKVAKDAIEEIFITMERIIEQFRNMNPMVLFDLEKFHYKAYQHFLAHKTQFMQKIIRENIEWGIREELYRPEINIDVMSKFRIESMMIAFNISVFPPGKYNLADVTQTIIEHFVYGLATIKGHKLIQKYNKERQKKLYEYRK